MNAYMLKILSFFEVRHHQANNYRRPGFAVSIGVIALFILTGMISCDNYREADPVITHYAQITNSSRDTIISIFNEKLSTEATVTFQETLSDMAIVKFSSDTSFAEKGGFLIPIKNPPLMGIGGLVGDSLYIKYQPLNKPVSGNVTIGVTFR